MHAEATAAIGFIARGPDGFRGVGERTLHTMPIRNSVYYISHPSKKSNSPGELSQPNTHIRHG